MNRMHMLALAFSILLAVPLAWALPSLTMPPSSPANAANFQTLWSTYGWQAVGAATVLVAMSIVSLAYMLGVAFRQPQITAWAKNELFQALMTAFMFAFIVGFVFFLANFTSAASHAFVTSETAVDLCSYEVLCPSGTQFCEYHIEKAWCIANSLQQKAVKQTDVVLNINFRAAQLASTGKYFDLSANPTGQLTYPWETCFGVPETCSQSAVGFGFGYYAGVSMLTEALGMIFPVLFMWITSFIAQAAFLVIVRDAIFPIFLTLGLILRTLFFTRKLGGLLIAIAIGVYTIYPFMYVLFEDTYDFTLWEDKYNGWNCLCDGAWPAASYDQLLHCPVRWCTGSMIEIIIYGKALIFDVGVEPVDISLFSAAHSISGTSSVHPADFLFVGSGTDPSLLQIVGMLMVPSLMIPLISALVTIAFIKGLSPLLGGDVEIAGLTHLI